jgi:hypothetical protein
MLSDLIGKTFTKIENLGDRLIFHTDSGIKYEMYHEQDCCEQVSLEDIAGDLDDLIGVPIVRAEESCKEDPAGPDSCSMWTFYLFATSKGYVTLRWYGHSNGYYGVGVSLKRMEYGT